MEAVALHDFTAHHSNEDELPFRKGSILKVKFQINRSKIYGFNSFTCFRASQEVGDKPDLIRTRVTDIFRSNNCLCEIKVYFHN